MKNEEINVENIRIEILSSSHKEKIKKLNLMKRN